MGWNPAQFLHFGPIAARFPRAVYVIEDRPESRVFDFENLPGAPPKILRLKPESLQSIDGKFDVIVCQSPFAGMENLRRTRLAMLQVGYARAGWNFAPWRSMADLCLTFGNYGTRQLETYAPCVRIGNPRYAHWGKLEFQQAAVAKYAPLLDPMKKTLLYAPTWGTACSLETYAAALTELGRDYNVICHLHPRGKLQSGMDINGLRQCFKLVCTSRDDIAELLAVANLLITDISGAIFDAVFCRKPVVMLETSHSGNKGDRGGVEYDRRRELGRQVSTPAELAPAVMEAILSRNSNIREQEALRDDLFANPGGAAGAAKKALIQLADEPLPTTEVQQALRAAMRTAFRHQSQLQNARSWRGFLRYQLATGRSMARQFLARKTQTPDQTPSSVPQPKLSAPSQGAISGRMIHIRFDTPAHEILAQIHAPHPDGPPLFVHVALGSEINPGSHLQEIAAHNPQARACIVALSSAGYYTCETTGSVTRAVREDQIRHMWEEVANGTYQINEDGLIHTFTPPLDDRVAKRLLVMFSSMNSTQPGITRFFSQDFPTVQKYIPPATAVLRIADIGGVIGAFYLNTTHRPNFAELVQKLIRTHLEKLGIDHDSVVLFGFSKGGTGAIYHGMRGKYRFISGDPILSDDEFRDDPYFSTGGAFPERKSQVFARLFDQIEADDHASSLRGRAAVVSSDRSVLYPYLTTTLIDRFGDRMLILNSQNPLISGHVGLGFRVLNSLTMLLNMQLSGLELPGGVRNID